MQSKYVRRSNNGIPFGFTTARDIHSLRDKCKENLIKIPNLNWDGLVLLLKKIGSLKTKKQYPQTE